jgi:hypothetical protein
MPIQESMYFSMVCEHQKYGAIFRVYLNIFCTDRLKFKSYLDNLELALDR